VAGKLSIGAAWAEAAAFLRRERRLLAPVVLGLVMVPAVVASMVQPPVPNGASAGSGAWLIIALPMLVLMMVGQMAIVLLANGWHGSVGQAIARAFRRLPTLLLVALLIIGPLIVILALILSASGVAVGADGRLAGGNLGPVGSLMTLIVIAALLFGAIRLLPLVALVATGDDGPLAAIRRTFAATRGHFWRLLAFLLLMLVAYAVVGSVTVVISDLLVAFLFGDPEPWSVALLLLALIAGLFQTAFIAIYTAMLARIAAQIAATPTNGI
jgi:hypothetical protein